jgi:spoIIIJ-associated protein
MSPFIEFEGKNVELAMTRACKALNIPRDQLKHDVISFGATGIFGLVGTKKARIRVPVPGVRMADAQAAENSPLPQNAPGDPLPATADMLEKTDSGQQAPQPTAAEDSADLGRLALQRMLDSVTSGAQIAVNCDSRQIVYTVSGGNPAAIIGKRGQTLEAIQYLLKKIVNKLAEGRTRIVIDIPGHAAKRRNELESLASQFAEKACQNGQCITVGRFSPQDRKIIHLALKKDRRVKTQSKGAGYLKKLVVMPRGE